MFDALNSQNGPFLLRNTAIILIIVDAVPKQLSAPAFHWMSERRAMIVHS